MSFFSTGSNVLLIFLGFGMLIFIHELGHFLAAKWVGIRAEGFCVGFGAPLISYRRGVGIRLGGTDESSKKKLGKAQQVGMATHPRGETIYRHPSFPLACTRNHGLSHQQSLQPSPL